MKNTLIGLGFLIFAALFFWTGFEYCSEPYYSARESGAFCYLGGLGCLVFAFAYLGEP